MTESWRPVVGFEDIYSVSDQGRVRRDKIARGAKVGRILKPTVDKRGGYLSFSLYRGNRAARFRVKIHTLVAAAFIGPRPVGTEVLHGDGDPTHNQPSNLRYGTRGENNLDSVAHGTHPWASRTQCPSGHPYDEGNTYVTPQGKRRCRRCLAARELARYHRRKKAAA